MTILLRKMCIHWWMSIRHICCYSNSGVAYDYSLTFDEEISHLQKLNEVTTKGPRRAWQGLKNRRMDVRLYAGNSMTYGKYLRDVRSRTFTAVERFCISLIAEILQLNSLLLPNSNLMFTQYKSRFIWRLRILLCKKNPELFMLRYAFDGIK